MATFLIDAASVIDAYEWMYQKSVQDQKRLVINQSWGLHHMGNLDGTSILSQAIDYYSQLGVVFVSSGGNNGDVLFHIKKTFTNDTIKTRVNFYTYSFPTMWGQSISLWGEQQKSFSAKLEILNTSNVVVAETPFFNSVTQTSYIDTILVLGSDTIFYNLASEAQNLLNNRPHMRLRVKNNKTYLKVVLKLTAIDGTVHAWNVVELTNDVGNWGQAFSKVNTTYTGGDKFYGISEPACTNSTIAVAAYSTGANIAAFSSLGPTLDERVKPDIAAPGVNIASSLSSFTDASPSILTNVDFLGNTYPFGRLSGTSMAGPMVAGIVALLLEANPYLSAYQVKEIIQQTARQDSYTGTIPTEGSFTWGAGKINAYQAVKLALQTIGNVGIESLNVREFKLYPNPSETELKIDFNSTLSEVQLIDLNGRIIRMQV
jgi:minor extracellular serine protease Vpr